MERIKYNVSNTSSSVACVAAAAAAEQVYPAVTTQYMISFGSIILAFRCPVTIITNFRTEFILIFNAFSSYSMLSP
jgi:hypothetical protein